MWLFHYLVNVLDLAFYDTHSMKTGRCYLLIESKTTFFGFFSGGSLWQKQIIPSWTSFYITIHEGLPGINDLDCIDLPATDISIIYKVSLNIVVTVFI